ncbi:MAG: hypothetical protein ACLUJG_01740 [Lawsonibacter sp.]
MKQDEFDLRLTQEMADLPPDPGEVQDYNPWQAAMSRILWGMALTTFRLEFFYLQYLLPLLGAALMYLGYRSLRRENPWFRLCWGLSGLLLAIHIALDILAATPVMGWIAGNPAVNWGSPGPSGDGPAPPSSPCGGAPGPPSAPWGEAQPPGTG